MRGLRFAAWEMVRECGGVGEGGRGKAAASLDGSEFGGRWGRSLSHSLSLLCSLIRPDRAAPPEVQAAEWGPAYYPVRSSAGFGHRAGPWLLGTPLATCLSLTAE